MNPKEQAKEIINKYRKILIKNNNFSKPQSININQAAIECSLEEVNSIKETYKNKNITYYIEVDKWEEVKQILIEYQNESQKAFK